MTGETGQWRISSQTNSMAPSTGCSGHSEKNTTFQRGITHRKYSHISHLTIYTTNILNTANLYSYVQSLLGYVKSVRQGKMLLQSSGVVGISVSFSGVSRGAAPTDVTVSRGHADLAT